MIVHGSKFDVQNHGKSMAKPSAPRHSTGEPYGAYGLLLAFSTQLVATVRTSEQSSETMHTETVSLGFFKDFSSVFKCLQCLYLSCRDTYLVISHHIRAYCVYLCTSCEDSMPKSWDRTAPQHKRSSHDRNICETSEWS